MDPAVPDETDSDCQPQQPAKPRAGITPTLTSDTAASSKGKEPVYQHDSVFEESDVSHSGGEQLHSPTFRVGSSPSRLPLPIAIKVSNSSSQQQTISMDNVDGSESESNLPPSAVSLSDGEEQEEEPPSEEAGEDEEGETDPYSDYSDETASLTESITSTNYQYRYENGRRYHGFGDSVSYLLPNDEREQERLDSQHKTWLLTLSSRLHLSPISPFIQNVLDIGTGTGAWAIAFADQYPSASVFGTDLSPIQPNFVPPNCQFVVEDSIGGGDWVWGEATFDFVHVRDLAVGVENWASLLQNCWRVLKPGGWLEIQEFSFPFEYASDFDSDSDQESDSDCDRYDKLNSNSNLDNEPIITNSHHDLRRSASPTSSTPRAHTTDSPSSKLASSPTATPTSSSPRNSPLHRWSAHFTESHARAGIDLSAPSSLSFLLTSTGFTQITSHSYRQPFSAWPHDAAESQRGELFGRSFDWGMAITPFVKRLGWRREEAEVFLVGVRKEVGRKGAASEEGGEGGDRGDRWYLPVWVYTARKPP